MAETADVLIIGGGMIGLTTAYFLAREGIRVVVADKGELGQESSWAGAGILPAGNPKRAKSPLGQLRACSVAMFPQLSEELRELTGLSNGYLRCGGFELRRSPGAPGLERQRVENLVREERGEGLHCEVLDNQQLRELEPALSETLPGAVYFPEMAQVRNPWHVKALIAACRQKGVELRPHCPVVSLRRSGGEVQAAETPNGPIAAGQFLVAAGCWSDMVLQSVGPGAPGLDIRPIRGQIALLNPGAPGPILFRRILQAGSQYLVPRGDGRVLVGSTEEDVGFEKRTTAEAIRGLLDLAIELVSGLAHATVEKCWAGLRPGSPQGRPFLGAVPGSGNLFVAAGHFRSGIQLSPGTALVMKELLLSQPLSVPLESFMPNRRLRRPNAEPD